MTATVVVVYTGGAATPIELAADSEGYTLLFAAPVGALRDGLAELLAAVGDLVDVTDEAAGAAVLAARRPAGIVTFSDRDLPLTAGLAARLGLPYHSASAVLAATDKYVQRQRLRDAGLRVPRFCALDRPDQVVAALTAVGTPAVLKPRRGAGSRHTYRLDDPETALRHAIGAFAAGECDAFVVEEMLVGRPSVAGLGLGDYASVEMLVSCGAVAYRTITGRLPLQQPFRERGFFLPGRLPADVAAAAYQLAEAAWRALGLWDGWIHVEMKLTADGPVVIEVNGRLGGYIAVMLYRSGGVQAVRMALDAAVGRRPVVPVGDPSAVAFGYQIMPPVGDWRLTSWGSVADLADRSDIVSVILTAAPGRLATGQRGHARGGGGRGRGTGGATRRGPRDRAHDRGRGGLQPGVVLRRGTCGDADRVLAGRAGDSVSRKSSASSSYAPATRTGASGHAGPGSLGQPGLRAGRRRS